MKFVEITVHDKYGKPEQAHGVLCESCGGRSFYLFRLMRHQHEHMQCAGCGTTYCADPEACKRATAKGV